MFGEALHTKIQQKNERREKETRIAIEMCHVLHAHFEFMFFAASFFLLVAKHQPNKETKRAKEKKNARINVLKIVLVTTLLMSDGLVKKIFVYNIYVCAWA